MTRTSVKLVPTVSVVPLDDGVALVRGRRMVSLRGEVGRLGRVAAALRAGTDTAALRAELTPDEAGALLDRLDREGWLTGADEPAGGVDGVQERQLGYLSLFGPDAHAMQARLAAARVGVLGVGGIGALLAQHAVAAGVRQLWLVDHDVVAPHNLNRQYLFGLEDVGRPKVEAAVPALRRLSSELALHTLTRAVAEPSDLDPLPSDLDLLVVAADTPATIRDIAWEWAAATGVPVVLSAVGLTSGYWGPLLDPGRGDCWYCWEQHRLAGLSQTERRLEAALSDPTPYSFGPANSAVAALLGYEVCRFLATGVCEIDQRRGILDLQRGAISFHPGPAEDCPGHP